MFSRIICRVVLLRKRLRYKTGDNRKAATQHRPQENWKEPRAAIFQKTFARYRYRQKGRLEHWPIRARPKPKQLSQKYSDFQERYAELSQQLVTFLNSICLDGKAERAPSNLFH